MQILIDAALWKLSESDRSQFGQAVPYRLIGEWAHQVGEPYATLYYMRDVSQVLARWLTAESMVQFGHELRLEREQRRVSLEAMCASTKLSVRQLLDVEAGNFRELPGGIFRKGFVRSYLRALQLDEPFWLERFESSYRASGLADSQEPDWASFAENVRNNRLAGKSSGNSRKWLGVLGMAILVVLLAVCVWKFVLLPKVNHGQRREFSQSAPASSHALASTQPRM